MLKTVITPLTNAPPLETFRVGEPLAVATPGDMRQLRFLQNPNGDFTEVRVKEAPGKFTVHLYRQLVEQTTYEDLVLVEEQQNLETTFGARNGVIQSVQHRGADFLRFTLDVNGDGVVDEAVAHKAAMVGLFAPERDGSVDPSASPVQVTLKDLDGDGRPDEKVTVWRE